MKLNKDSRTFTSYQPGFTKYFIGMSSGVRREKFGGGGQGRGTEPPGRRKIFENFQKIP